MEVLLAVPSKLFDCLQMLPYRKMSVEVEPLVSGSVIGAQLFNRLVWGIQWVGEDGAGERCR